MRGKNLYFVVEGTHHPRFLLSLLLWNINISSKSCTQMHLDQEVPMSKFHIHVCVYLRMTVYTNTT